VDCSKRELSPLFNNIPQSSTLPAAAAAAAAVVDWLRAVSSSLSFLDETMLADADGSLFQLQLAERESGLVDDNAAAALDRNDAAWNTPD